MTEEEYKAFWHELTSAEAVQPKDFEKEIYFEGCMPVEIMASVGKTHCAMVHLNQLV